MSKTVFLIALIVLCVPLGVNSTDDCKKDVRYILIFTMRRRSRKRFRRI